MIKGTLLKLSIVLIGLFFGIAQLCAQTTYYYTGALYPGYYQYVGNWNTERDGTGENLTILATNKGTAGMTLIIPDGKAVDNVNANIAVYGHLVIESGGILDASTGNNITITLSGNSRVTIEEGGTIITSWFSMASNTVLTVAGKSTTKEGITASSSSSNATIDVEAGAELTTPYLSGVGVVNNGTINLSSGDANRYISSIDGQGVLNIENCFMVNDVANSGFLQSNGGIINYTAASASADIALISSYNDVKIKNVASDRTFTGESLVHGNLSLTDNTAQVTFDNNITIEGDLTIADSKVVTDGALTVAGSINISGLAEGSLLNLILNGTEQNIEGVFNNLEIAAGTVATMTGDLTVESLVLAGTLLNPNNYTLTVTNQTDIDAYKTQLQIAISGANILTEADYTAESWARLSAAISTGQALLAEEANPTTVQLGDAKTAVTSAIAALVTNLSVLESWFNTVKATYPDAPTTVYTPESYAILQTAITSVETFLTGTTAITATELTAQQAAINTAIAALVREVYTFQLVTGSNDLSWQNWNTSPDGTGIQAVAFAPENTGHTYIIPRRFSTDNPAILSITLYESTLVVDTAANIMLSPTLHGSSIIVRKDAVLKGRYISGASANGKQSVIRVERDGKLTNNNDGTGVVAEITGDIKLIVDEGALAEKIVFGTHNSPAPIAVEVNGTIRTGETGQNGSSIPNISVLTGSGTFITGKELNLLDAAASTFLGEDGGTLVYNTTITTVQPSYNHLTIEEITTAATLGREVTTDTVPVYGNLLLSNNHRRVEFSNPLAVAGDFTVDYDIEDEAVVRVTLTVAGNVSLSGLLPEDHALNVTLAGTEEQDLSGAGFTNLTLPEGTSAVLTGNLSIEAALTLNGVLDRNGRTLSFGNRSGNGILTDGLLAAALQDSIDQANADYPDGSIYTTASWQALQTAIEAGEALLAGETPAEVAALEVAIEAIAAAIEGLESATGLVPPSGDTWRIHAGASTLSVTGNVDLRVVTLAGREAYHGRVTGEKTLRLPAGVYIVTVNGRSGKVVIR